MASGGDLRDARTRMGLSMEEAARRTKIPQRYLEALERGDLSVFPAGPFASGYTRQYRRFLSLPDAALPSPQREVTERTLPTVTSPLLPSRPRVVALGAAVFVTLGLAVAVGRAAITPAVEEVGQVPDQVVLLTTNEPLRATITSDGRDVFSGMLPAGEQKRFEAHDRLELDLANLDGVSVVYNGRTLKPLGAQSRPRRLVFIDDHGQD
jgi:hypothetical protein